MARTLSLTIFFAFTVTAFTVTVAPNGLTNCSANTFEAMCEASDTPRNVTGVQTSLRVSPMAQHARLIWLQRISPPRASHSVQLRQSRCIWRSGHTVR